MNLHRIVNAAVSTVQPMVEVYVLQSSGVKNIKGEFTAVYDAPLKTMARFQTDNDEALEHIDNVNQNYIGRKIYIETKPENRISEINRVKAKSGDYIYRVNDASWWLVTATLDEFAEQGWVCVRGTLQVTPPVANFIEAL